MKRTKILATLGPASDSADILEGMFAAGMNAVRCNFSHGSAQDHKDRVDLVRKAASKTGVKVGILGDLQGPKIRVGKLNNHIKLKKGSHVYFNTKEKNKKEKNRKRKTKLRKRKTLQKYLKPVAHSLL